MDTVQFQCGNCGKLMAVAEAHLGGQVKCPHCQTVVQAPLPPPTISVPDLGERESIFAAPEPTDDLFDSSPSTPLIEMPPKAPPPPPPVRVELQPVASPDSSGGASPSTPEIFLSPGQPAPAGFSEHLAPTSDDADADLGALTRRALPRQSLAPHIALIFLVPYALITTAFIIYLLATQSRVQHPFDMLPDSRKDKGGPRQVQHDLPLAPHQKTTLGQPLRVGSLEVTPLRVQVVDGNLVLALRVKNISDNLIFNPIHDDYLKIIVSPETGNPANYTFVETGRFDRLYGGFLEWMKGPPGKEQPTDNGDLAPGQEELIVITTMDKYRPIVKQLVSTPDEKLLWRVQLRRGLVPYNSQMVSATTVVGVQFTTRDIQKLAS